MMKTYKKTQVLAVCAVLAAVIVCLNFIASLHIIRLDAVFYLLSGALVYFAAQRFGLGPGGILYAAAALLSLVIVPDKIWLLFFICAFGPAAILQAFFEKRANRMISAIITAVSFTLLFCLFSGIVMLLDDGFFNRLGMPEQTVFSPQLIILVFAIFSAIIAYVVNRGFYMLMTRRLKGLFGVYKPHAPENDSEKNGQQGGIILPKLSDDEK